MKPNLKRIEATLHYLEETSLVNEERENFTQDESGLSLASVESQKPEGLAKFSMSVPTFPVQKYQEQTPALPKLKAPSFSSHRHAANPALATNLLQEIVAIVAGWQQELQQVLRQIQDIYLSGPIVDGWLESRSEERGSTRAGYRLYGLDADGQLWWRDCPPEQVASVSVAIARHQKLRHLLNRKDYLETRLAQLAETLVVLHGHLQAE